MDNKSIPDIVRKLNNNKGKIYIQIKEQRSDGYIRKEDLELTEAGRVSVKWKPKGSAPEPPREKYTKGIKIF